MEYLLILACILLVLYCAYSDMTRKRRMLKRLRTIKVEDDLDMYTLKAFILSMEVDEIVYHSYLRAMKRLLRTNAVLTRKQAEALEWAIGRQEYWRIRK